MSSYLKGYERVAACELETSCALLVSYELKLMSWQEDPPRFGRASGGASESVGVCATRSFGIVALM